MAKRERPTVIVIKQGGGHGLIITVILAILAWPLAIIYWLVRMTKVAIGSSIDWLTAGPLRRRGRGY